MIMTFQYKYSLPALHCTSLNAIGYFVDCSLLTIFDVFIDTDTDESPRPSN